MLRAAWRWLWRWLSGAWSHVPPRWTEEEIERLGLLNRMRFRQWALRQPLDLHPLTGLRIALEFGAFPSVAAPYQLALDRARRTNLKRGIPSRLVGRPVIYEFPNKVKIGVTEWVDGYVPRTEQLKARRTLRAAAQATITP